MKYRFERAGVTVEIDVKPTAQGYMLQGPDGKPQLIELRTRADGSQLAVTPWGEVELVSARRGAEQWARVAGRRVSARIERARPNAAGAAGTQAAGVVRAPMAGKLLRLDVRLGDELRAGQAVAVIEAMKMENELVAPFAGVVVEVGATAPSTIDKGALLVRLEPR
ncbi:MAG TPA: acetyl-CoA carboxylase biotin carboxyl carrier protein subunit [Polyangiaceae bacterium]|nr:acetyl-CoA carboxylase biotin carboxyl carrier protein subunit [Polyangiaceae bacterium]